MEIKKEMGSFLIELFVAQSPYCDVPLCTLPRMHITAACAMTKSSLCTHNRIMVAETQLFVK
jgi:hypothetical protein